MKLQGVCLHINIICNTQPVLRDNAGKVSDVLRHTNSATDDSAPVLNSVILVNSFSPIASFLLLFQIVFPLSAIVTGTNLSPLPTLLS